MNAPLWSPDSSRISSSRLTRFTERMQGEYQLLDSEYMTLHQWSVEHPEQFWEEVWKDAGVISSAPYERVMGPPDFPRTEWFTGARLNFAENLLERGDDVDLALSFTGETTERRKYTRGDLKTLVARCAAGLRAQGVGKGDRVAAVIANCPEAVIAALACISLGAVWSSCSPDFGINGIHDRLGQIEPKVLITVNAYHYNGKEHRILRKIRDVAARISSIGATFVIPFTQTQIPLQHKEHSWEELLDNTEDQPFYEQVPFDHPVYILYSSGTTGLPKSIVHGGGGTLLKHCCEHIYHGDLRRGDRLFFFTTCGWMMWNWLVSGLAAEASIVLYDGSPTHPNVSRLFKLIDDEGITHFGTSPKFLGAVKKSGYHPRERHSLSSLRAVLSTGSPLPEDLFEWSYANVSPDIPLMSISGGTDLIGCFMLGNPNLPVYSGEIQCKALGMDTQSYNPEGLPVIGEKGELVCRNPFPSLPVRFWNDPDDARYRKAYFERFPGVWTHGDFIEITERGGVIIHGRSDTVLNPGGVRIGTAEIYRPVEELPEIVDCLVIGQPWHGDVRVVLFVVLREGSVLDAGREQHIRDAVRRHATPRHVPERILAIPDVPRTISGKKVEKAALQVLLGERVENTAALANPESLDFIAGLREQLQE